MIIYLQALNYEIWEVVCDGPFIPLTKNEVGEDIIKPSWECNELKKRKPSLNSKVMNALFCALDMKEFYEDTNQMKESTISMYTLQYELF